MRKWQEKWTAETRTVQRIKKLIPQIELWMTRQYGEVGFYLTKFLLGHGRFKTQLFRMKITDNENGALCQQRDTPENSSSVLQMERHQTGSHRSDKRRKWTALEKIITKIMKRTGREKDLVYHYYNWTWATSNYLFFFGSNTFPVVPEEGTRDIRGCFQWVTALEFPHYSALWPQHRVSVKDFYHCLHISFFSFTVFIQQ